MGTFLSADKASKCNRQSGMSFEMLALQYSWEGETVVDSVEEGLTFMSLKTKISAHPWGQPLPDAYRLFTHDSELDEDFVIMGETAWGATKDRSHGRVIALLVEPPPAKKRPVETTPTPAKKVKGSDRVSYLTKFVAAFGQSGQAGRPDAAKEVVSILEQMYGGDGRGLVSATSCASVEQLTSLTDMKASLAKLIAALGVVSLTALFSLAGGARAIHLLCRAFLLASFQAVHKINDPAIKVLVGHLPRASFDDHAVAKLLRALFQRHGVVRQFDANALEALGESVGVTSVQVLSKLEKLKEESIYGGDNDDKGGQRKKKAGEWMSVRTVSELERKTLPRAKSASVQCAGCKHATPEHFAECYFCRMAAHPECYGMTIKEIKDKIKREMQWVCPICVMIVEKVDSKVIKAFFGNADG